MIGELMPLMPTSADGAEPDAATPHTTLTHLPSLIVFSFGRSLGRSRKQLNADTHDVFKVAEQYAMHDVKQQHRLSFVIPHLPLLSLVTCCTFPLSYTCSFPVRQCTYHDALLD